MFDSAVITFFLANGVELMADYFIFSSFGNDSIALMQWANINLRDHNVHVGYSNTQWASRSWPKRVELCANIIKQLGWSYSEIPSEGLKNMVRRKKGFPRQGYQFCTGELKILPAIAWMESIDPDLKYTVLVGLRREESDGRKDTPDFMDESPNHGFRRIEYPLASYDNDKRNALVEDFGFEVLPHRSMECFPCINSNRDDLRVLAKDPKRIEEIAEFEKEMGFTSKGKPRTMFRPYRHMGATGIKEVVEWAKADKGKYDKNQPSFDLDDGTDGPNEGGCLNGWCGI